MKGLIVTLILISLWLLIGSIPSIKQDNDEYNKRMCAFDDKFEDCKTPLPAELRLK